MPLSSNPKVPSSYSLSSLSQQNFFFFLPHHTTCGILLPWKWKSLSPIQLFWPHGLYSPWNSPGQNTGMHSLFPSPGDLPNPGIEPRSPTLHVDSLPAEPPWPGIKPVSPVVQAWCPNYWTTREFSRALLITMNRADNSFKYSFTFHPFLSFW